MVFKMYCYYHCDRSRDPGLSGTSPLPLTQNDTWGVTFPLAAPARALFYLPVLARGRGATSSARRSGHASIMMKQ